MLLLAIKLVYLVATALVGLSNVDGIPLASFYPFGLDANDCALPPNDDGSSPAVNLSTPFLYFGSSYSSLFVNNNGDLSFDTPLDEFTPQPFPLDETLIAPFWADVDISAPGSGSVWYREANDIGLLTRARDEIQSFINNNGQAFNPTHLFIATWDHVGYYEQNFDKASTDECSVDVMNSLQNLQTNTFQCILATNGESSYVIFLYADGGIQWTTGDASDGVGGLGGTPAHVGLNAGDGINFVNVPGSETSSIINITRTSNVCKAGVWIFRVDDLESTTSSSSTDCIRMQYTGRSNFQIFNNTVINAFPPPMTTGEAPFNSPLFPRLEVDCNTVQGDELPIWTTNNVITGNASGVVVGDEQEIFYGSSVNSDYSTTLFFYIIDPNFNGFYRCRSRRSGLFSEFFLTTENPFIVLVSPAVVTVDEGDPARLEFQIALNSDGNTWNTEAISFFFSSNNDNDGGRDEVSFLVDSIMFPQNFARNFTSVSREDAGLYITQVFDTTCQFDDSTCFIEENITLNIILYCPSNPDAGILWPRTRQNTVASAPCSQGGSFFREGPLATRRCMENGEWADVDFTGCTLVESSRPFLLLTLVIEADEVEGESERLLVMQVSSLLDDYNVPYTDVTLQSAFIASVALTFQVTVDPSVSPQTFLGPLSAFLDFFNNDLLALGETFVITTPGSRGIVGVVPSDSCPCVSGVNSSATFLPLCEGTSLSPCDCNEEQCQCQDPFVGDGLSCTLDTDGDGYPDSPLQSCTPESTEIYCIQDICPTVNNPNQDLLECRPNVVITEPEFTGCPYGPDPAWNITWANTERGTTDVQRCPGGVDTLGMATRFCDRNGNWSNPLVLECTSVEFVRIEARAGVIFTSFSAGTIGSAELATATAAITLDLTVATETETISLLPSDLNSTNSILSSLLSVLEAELEDPDAADGPPDVSLVDIFDNVLEDTNTQGWLELQTVNTGSQVLLDSAERYALYLARSSNDTSSEVILSRPNIVISGRMVDSNSLSVLNDSIVFPQEQHLVNSSGISLTQITIPVGLVRERLINEATTDQSIPVANILFQSLERFLPPSFPGLNNSRGASPVIASQVGSERRTVPSSVLLDTPVSLSFTFEMIEEALEFQCVFWNFSEPVGNGRFISTGVQLIRNTTNGNTTTVLCESTHLTSFAVLVDVTGTLQGISEAEQLALQVVSYIGCAISVICLIITIIYFLMQGKKLFNAVHYFVHLNLAISLCLGYLIFLIGIETATSSDGGCAFVAALLHYFFLASFCWMLCEGIMLYLMLVVVFSSLTKKWWFFLLIGYALPLPAVVIGLAARHDYYGVRVDGELEFCWLSAEKGTIWAFVAPMIVIIMVNVVFLCLVLRSLWKNKKGHKAHKMKEDSEILQLVKTTFKSVVILLPLLGLTWMFGILTLNANSTVFAWFFLIFNSTQGIFILIFHVIRSDKVWSKIGPRLSQLRSTRFQKYRVSRSSVSQTASTSSTFLKGAFRRKQDSDSAAVEMGTLRSNTSVTDNTGTLTFHTGSTIHTEEQSATVVENEGVVDPLPEKVAL